MVLKDEYEYGGKLNGVLKELACLIIVIEIILSLLFMVARPNYLTFTTFFDIDAILFIALIISLAGIDLSTIFATTVPKTCSRIIKFKSYKNIEVIIGILITCMSKFIILMLPIFIILYVSIQYYSAHIDLVLLFYILLILLSNSFLNISLDIYIISIFKNNKFGMFLKIGFLGFSALLFNFFADSFCYNMSDYDIRTAIVFLTTLYTIFLQIIFSLILLFISARSNGKIIEYYENTNNFCAIPANNKTLTFYCIDFVNFFVNFFVMTILLTINFTIYGLVFLDDIFKTHEYEQKGYVFQYLLIFTLAILSFKIYIFIKLKFDKLIEHYKKNVTTKENDKK